MSTSNLEKIVADLRRTGGDHTSVEVKSAAGGLPDSLTSTLSALANLPQGGLIILGLDEEANFQPVTLKNPHKLKQGLASKARNYTPPVQMSIDDVRFEGKTVIVARIYECDPSMKPCKVTKSGEAYLRGYDGDFLLSDVEEQAFLAARHSPQLDKKVCDGASLGDLDAGLVDSFAETVRERDPYGLGRFTDRDELLRRAGVVTSDGVPTIAGILTLGAYPQQWFPRYVVQAAADPGPGAPPEERVRHQATLSGPIPMMLDGAMAWARRSFDTKIMTRADGTVHDDYAYPLAAFRELVANALIHRDLDEWSRGMAVEVRLRRDKLVISNPGGLYGISADRLGTEAVTSARNARLVNICQFVRSPYGGGRVIEALATGMPIISDALTQAGLPPGHFIDTGIRFTAILRQTSVPRSQQRSAAQAVPAQGASLTQIEPPILNPSEKAIYEELEKGSLTVSQMAERLGLSSSGIRKALSHLRELGMVMQRGGIGRRTTYERLRLT